MIYLIIFNNKMHGSAAGHAAFQSNVASSTSQKDIEKEFKTIFGHLDPNIKLLSCETIPLKVN